MLSRQSLANFWYVKAVLGAAKTPNPGGKPLPAKMDELNSAQFAWSGFMTHHGVPEDWTPCSATFPSTDWSPAESGSTGPYCPLDPDLGKPGTVSPSRASSLLERLTHGLWGVLGRDRGARSVEIGERGPVMSPAAPSEEHSTREEKPGNRGVGGGTSSARKSPGIVASAEDRDMVVNGKEAEKTTTLLEVRSYL